LFCTIETSDFTLRLQAPQKEEQKVASPKKKSKLRAKKAVIRTPTVVESPTEDNCQPHKVCLNGGCIDSLCKLPLGDSGIVVLDEDDDIRQADAVTEGDLSFDDAFLNADSPIKKQNQQPSAEKDVDLSFDDDFLQEKRCSLCHLLFAHDATESVLAAHQADCMFVAQCIGDGWKKRIISFLIFRGLLAWTAVHQRTARPLHTLPPPAEWVCISRLNSC
jgi:hypothetical protein